MKSRRGVTVPILLSAFLAAFLGATPVVVASSGGGSGSPGPSSTADPGALSLFKTYSGTVGYAVGDVGLANSPTGSGSISISGIPAGSTVLGALIYWDVVDIHPTPGYPALTFAGSPISGTLLGGTSPGDDPCYSSPGTDTGTAPTYEADVTALVSGNGVYSVSGLPPGDWQAALPFADGVGMVVVYSNPSLPSTVIDIAQGFGVVNNLYGSETSTLNLAPPASGTFAKTTFLVGDPQYLFGGGADDVFEFQGVTLAEASQTPYNDTFFATYTSDVTSSVPSGTTAVTFGVSLVRDCLVHMAQVFQYTQAPVTGVPEFGLPSLLVAATGVAAVALLKTRSLPLSRRVSRA